MNTYELERAIGDYVKRFDGVFASDRLPTKPRLFVCNTDPSDMPGEHWIAIYVDDNGHYGEYFDSLGRPPNRLFEHYMNEHCREWTYNCKQLQCRLNQRARRARAQGPEPQGAPKHQPMRYFFSLN